MGPPQLIFLFLRLAITNLRDLNAGTRKCWTCYIVHRQSNPCGCCGPPKDMLIMKRHLFGNTTTYHNFYSNEESDQQKQTVLILWPQQSCNTPLHEMELDVARFSVFIVLTWMPWWRMCKRHPDVCRGSVLPKGATCTSWYPDTRDGKCFWFSPPNSFYSVLKSYRLPDASRVTLIGLRCLFWRRCMPMPRRCNSARETEFLLQLPYPGSRGPETCLVRPGLNIAGATDWKHPK